MNNEEYSTKSETGLLFFLLVGVFLLSCFYYRNLNQRIEKLEKQNSNLVEIKK